MLVDEKINVFYKKNNEKIYILIGHAYNPFDGVYDEDELIENLFQNVFLIILINGLAYLHLSAFMIIN